MNSEDDLVREGKEAFRLCAEREEENREAAIEDIKFGRLDEQWPDYAKASRKDRPMLTINKLAPMARQVVNDGRQNRPSITIHPVGEGADDETAEVMNGLIRNIETISDADTAYDTGLGSAVDGGWGYWKVNTRYCDDDSFDQDIVIETVPDPLTIYGDPYSMAKDSSDWNTAFETELMTKEAFETRFPDAAEIDFEADYKEVDQDWRQDDRVLVAAWWQRESSTKQIALLSDGSVVDLEAYKANKDAYDAQDPPVTVEGSPRTVRTHKVEQRLMTGVEVLEVTPWAGKYIPIIPVYGDEVVIEGKRIFRSFIRGAKDAQRMYNYARSSETELVALSPKTPFIGKKGVFDHDIDKWNRANAESFPFIEYDGVEPPQRQPYAGPPAGWMQLAQSADGDIKAQLGMFDASLGQNAANEQSGKAILGLQKESDTSTFHFMDNQARSIRHCGRVIIDLIPHVYSTARVQRIITGEGDHQSVPINQPVPIQGPDGQPIQKVGANNQPLIDPVSGQPIQVTKIFDLTQGKYDLTVEAGPNFATRREEAANQMVQVIQANPASAPIIAPELFKALDWPGHEKLADKFNALAQSQQQAAQAKQPNPQADAAEAQAKAQGDAQAVQQKAQLDAQIAQQKAQHDAALSQQKLQADIAINRQKAESDAQLQRDRMQADIAIQSRKAELEADLQRQRFALEAQNRQTLDPVAPGGAVG